MRAGDRNQWVRRPRRLFLTPAAMIAGACTRRGWNLLRMVTGRQQLKMRLGEGTAGRAGGGARLGGPAKVPELPPPARARLERGAVGKSDDSAPSAQPEQDPPRVLAVDVTPWWV